MCLIIYQKYALNKTSEYHTVQAYLVLLHFALLHFTGTVVFHKLEVCGNLASNKSYQYHFFSNNIVHFMSLYHILVIQYVKIISQQKDYGLLKAQVVISFFLVIKYF